MNLHSTGGHTRAESPNKHSRGTSVRVRPVRHPQKTFPSFNLGTHIATFNLARRGRIRSRENGQKKNAPTKQVGTVRKDRWCREISRIEFPVIRLWISSIVETPERAVAVGGCATSSIYCEVQFESRSDIVLPLCRSRLTTAIRRPVTSGASCSW
jgi:hypothetical protein